nr:MAG: putative 20 kDa protein [Plant associated crinivirus 1]
MDKVSINVKRKPVAVHVYFSNVGLWTCKEYLKNPNDKSRLFLHDNMYTWDSAGGLRKTKFETVADLTIYANTNAGDTLRFHNEKHLFEKELEKYNGLTKVYINGVYMAVVITLGNKQYRTKVSALGDTVAWNKRYDSIVKCLSTIFAEYDCAPVQIGGCREY